MKTVIFTDDFRTAMDMPLATTNEACLRGTLQALINELLADPARRHDVRIQSMLVACRLRLRALQNLLAATQREQDLALWRCDIRSLLEDLCAAADLLLNPLGRTVRFDAPEELIEAACSPRELSWLVLELICNAARHTSGDEITVTMQLKRPRRSRRATACVVTVESAGQIDLAQLHASTTRENSGAAAMLRTAWLHHGALLWLERDAKAIATFRMPLKSPPLFEGGRSAATGGCLPYYDTPDLVELLSDQCSQLYVALAPLLP